MLALPGRAYFLFLSLGPAVLPGPFWPSDSVYLVVCSFVAFHCDIILYFVNFYKKNEKMS